MTKTNPLTRKAGPLPVWAWAALALVIGYVYLNRAPSASGGTQLPFTPASTGSAAQSGQGTAADNGNSDLLDALGNNLASSDALLAALQSGGQGDGYGGTSGTTTGDTSTISAPTVTSSTDPGTAPTDTTTAVSATAPASGAYYTPDVIDRYLTSHGVTTSHSTYSAPVTQPTPTVVQPAPVDTSNVIVKASGTRMIAS